MIINHNGATFEHEGITYTIGAPIVATDQSEYEGLTGHIFEVRDGADKETENDTPDLYCSFDPPNDPAEITKLEATISALYCTPKTLEDIALDLVIMAPDMVRPQKHADTKRLQSDVYQSIAEGKPCSEQARLVFNQVKVLSDAISAESCSQEVRMRKDKYSRVLYNDDGIEVPGILVRRWLRRPLFIPFHICISKAKKREAFSSRIHKEKRMNGQNRADVKVGTQVKIVLKADQRTGKLTEGVVERLLTKSSFHPHGIKVMLTDGQVGRVQEIIE